MASHVVPFRNRKNFFKCLMFYLEPGCDVFIQTILWLTGGDEELKRRLKELNNIFNDDEKKKLKEYLDGDVEFNTFDITFYFKICQNMSGILRPSHDHVWSVKKNKDRLEELEYLLVLLKNGRNEVSHDGIHYKNLTDIQVRDKSEEMEKLLVKILKKADEKAKISPEEFQTKVEKVKSDLEKIENDENIDKSLQPHVRNLILNDLKKKYKKELEDSFRNELKGYSIPYLMKQGESETCKLSSNHFNSQGTVIFGEAGAGKTALTKYLFHSWLTGDTESLKELAEFDIVLRIECGSITSSDLSLFFENHLPNAAYYFENTSSLSRHFKDLKVLWIMDGLDESTPEFKGFLGSIKSYIPQFHKVFLTTREHDFKDFQKFLPKVVTFNLDKLLNDNIKEILKNRFEAEEQHESFMKTYNSLNTAEKTLLETTPIYFTMYIDLWRKGSIIKEGAISPIRLYNELTKLDLIRLLEKHKNKTRLVSKRDLHLSIDRWFYGSLCKRSFLNFVAGKHFLGGGEISNLEVDATDGFLIPSTCLSSFLQSNKYKFKHSSQMLHYAASYVIKNPKDSSFDLKGRKLEMIDYIFKMVSEDDDVNKSSMQKFEIIYKFISSFKEFDQGFLWHKTWISSYLRDNIKEYYSRVLRSCFYVDKRTLCQPSVIEFVKYVEPKKVVIDTTIQNTKYISEFHQYFLQLPYGKLQMELRPSLPENRVQVIKYQITHRSNNAIQHVFYYEVVSNVIVRALRKLYVGPKPMEKHLMDLVAIYKNSLSSRDIYMLKELTEGNITIEELNPDLLLKVARIIYEVYVGSKSWWRKLWDWFTHGEVNISELFSDFNRLPHNLSKENNYENEYIKIYPRWDVSVIRELLNEAVAHTISYTGVTNREEEINQALTALLSTMDIHGTSEVVIEQIKNIVRKDMEGSNPVIKRIKSVLRGAGIDESIDHFQQRLRDLEAKPNFDIIDTFQAKNIISMELTEHYEVSKTCYDQEMKRYIPATLFDDANNGIDVSDISFEDYSVGTILISGDPGMGKSALARYLFTSWACGNMDSLVWLKSFDVVFLVNAKKIECKLVSELLEFLLPKSCNIFPTTNLLMKQLDKMKVLWIYEICDISCRLLDRLYERFFKSHKFLFTEYNRVVKQKFKAKHYEIGLPCLKNIDIFLSKSIPKSRFDHIRNSLMSRPDESSNELQYDPHMLRRPISMSLNDRVLESSKKLLDDSYFNNRMGYESYDNKLLYFPFYLSIHVELLQSETKTTLQLYSECELTETILDINYTNLQLQKLKDFSGCSESKVDKWFYGSLCRQCFCMIFNHRFTLQCTDLEVMKEDAVKENLDPETCLDFFFVKELGGAEDENYGFNQGRQPYILASFFLRKLKDYPPSLENEGLTIIRLEIIARVLNSFIIMAICEGLNETFAIETVSKVASTFVLDFKLKCLLWYKICETNNFQENVMKFFSKILNDLDCYVIHHEIQNFSHLAKFFKFVSPKDIRFNSIFSYEDKFDKEAYLDLLNMLKEKQLNISIGPIDPMNEDGLSNSAGGFNIVNVLDLINDASSLNLRSFEGEVSDLLLLRNHFRKLKKLNLKISSVGDYNELCTTLSKMDQLEKINLSFYHPFPSMEIYPVDFVARTYLWTYLCYQNLEMFDGFIKMIQSIKGGSTSKFQRLTVVANWPYAQQRIPDGQDIDSYRDYVNGFLCIINDHFSDFKFT